MARPTSRQASSYAFCVMWFSEGTRSESAQTPPSTLGLPRGPCSMHGRRASHLACLRINQSGETGLRLGLFVGVLLSWLLRRRRKAGGFLFSKLSSRCAQTSSEYEGTDTASCDTNEAMATRDVCPCSHMARRVIRKPGSTRAQGGTRRGGSRVSGGAVPTFVYTAAT